MNNTPPLEFWFDLGSPYSYLSVARIDALTAPQGLTVIWRPFLLGPLFKAQGFKDSPFNEDIPRRNYMWQDLTRQARKYGLPFTQPDEFPRRGLLATRIAVFGQDQAWVPEFCRRLMARNFVDNKEMDSPEAITFATRGLLEDPGALIAAATSDANKEATRMRSETARTRGIFGAPNFFIGETLFWGDDRLEDAIHWAKRAQSAAPGASIP